MSRLIKTVIQLTVVFVVLAFGAGTALAQLAWVIDNISPVRSDRDGSNPNSASGGRVNKLATHPTNNQVYFAASEWGGIYRTNDGGRNWTYVPGHRPQATWDVEFNPNNPNVLVATSNFDGKTVSEAGINVSRDGGVTWSVPASARPAAGDCLNPVDRSEPAAFGIAFDPANTSRIFVGTSCGLAVSTDNGLNWDYVDPTPGDGGGLRVVDVIVHNGGIIDICGDEGHMRSTDGGTTFTTGATNEGGGNCSLAVSPDEANVLFLSVGVNLFESRNGGQNWVAITTPPNPQGRIPFVKVNDRTGGNFDLWYGDTQLFRASCTTPTNTNSTARRCPVNSWTNAQTGSHWDVGDIVFDVSATNNSCPTLFSNDGGIYFNLRTGNNCHDPRWEQPTRSVTALWLWDMDGSVRVTPGDEGLYMGQQDSGAFGTREAGSGNPNWNSPGCCDVFDVEAESTRVIYTLCCSRTGRATRMFIDDPSMNGGGEIPNYPAGTLIGFRDVDTLSNYSPNRYALVTTAGVFFTTNIGAGTINWQNLGTNVPANACGIYSSRNSSGTPVFILRVGNGACSLGGVGSLWRLTGASTTGTWTRIDRNGTSQFGAFGVDPSDANHIVANDMSGANPAMVQTTNGGTNWQTLPNLDNMLRGNGAFVMEVQQGAVNGNGYAQASLAAINPLNSSMMVVGGQDSGLFLTVNRGVNWTLLTDPRTNTALRPHISRPLFAHFESTGNSRWNVYIGARGRGAWRIGLDVERRWAGAIWRSTGTPCSGNSCPGWIRLDNNIRTVDIVAGSNQLYQLHYNGWIWQSTNAACSGDNCPGWRRLDNNPATISIAAGGQNLYQLHANGRIWKWSGTPCSGNNCPGWRMLDNNPATVAIEASADRLYQLHRDGRIWQWTGQSCAGQSCPGWRMLDNNPRTVAIWATSNRLFQLHSDGRIWRHTGQACSGNTCPGWQMLDNNPRTADLGVNSGQLFQRHRNGWIWHSTGQDCSGNSCPNWRRLDNNSRTTAIAGGVYQAHDNGSLWRSTGTACSGNSCAGWQRLDNNPLTKFAIAADGSNSRFYQLHAPKLFQLHNNGAIWQSRGRPCSGNSCQHWQRLDNNHRTRAIVSGGGRLYQLHNDGKIWRSNGRPCVENSCPGWEMLDNNRRTVKIVASAGQLFQLHNDGAIWRFTGRPCNGNSCPSWIRLDNNPRTKEIVSSNGQLYQLHDNGRIWRWTGRACSGNSCVGWVMLDNNGRTTKIVAGGGLLHQLHSDGKIWTHTGVGCSGNSCPGWRMMDNNRRTVDIAAGRRELYQIHDNGSIWEATGVPCVGNSCSGWRMMDNNPRSLEIAAAGGILYQRHNNGEIWRSTGRPCSGNSCPGWVRLDNNPRTISIVASEE